MTWFKENKLTIKEFQWRLHEVYKCDWEQFLHIRFNETDVELVLSEEDFKNILNHTKLNVCLSCEDDVNK